MLFTFESIFRASANFINFKHRTLADEKKVSLIVLMGQVFLLVFLDIQSVENNTDLKQSYLIEENLS